VRVFNGRPLRVIRRVAFQPPTIFVHNDTSRYWRILHLPFFEDANGFFWRLWRLSRNRYDAIPIHTEQAGF
jgi:hypothetical protein